MPMQRSLLLYVAGITLITSIGLGCRTSDCKRNAQIEANLDNRMNYYVQAYGSKEKLEKATGKTYAEIRAENRESIAKALANKKARSSNLAHQNN